MAALTATWLCLLAVARHADVSGTDDDVWRFRSPVVSLISSMTAAGAFLLGSWWLYFLGKSGAVARTTNRYSTEYAVWVGVVGIVFSTAALVSLIVVVAFSPQHTLLEVTLDSNGMRVRSGLRRPVDVPWESVYNITTSGPEKSELLSEVTVYYRVGRRKLSKLHFPFAITRVDPVTLESILRARWEPHAERADDGPQA